MDNPAIKGDQKDRLGVHGWNHACLKVDNVDKTLEELRRRGVTIIGGPMDFTGIKRRGAFFEDAWGNGFEIIQEL